jgi:hypothetical protein
VTFTRFRFRGSVRAHGPEVTVEDRSSQQPPTVELSRAALEQIAILVHAQVRAQLDAERARQAAEPLPQMQWQPPVTPDRLHDAAPKRRKPKRRSPRERFINRRKGHCPHCGEIRMYAGIAALPGKRLCHQRCQVCGTMLGRRTNARAREIEAALEAAKEATAKANRRARSGTSGARNGGLQRLDVRAELPLNAQHSGVNSRVDAAGTRL